MIHPPPLGNIRRAEHFLGFMRRFIAHLADVMRAQHVTSEGPASFLAKVQEAVRAWLFARFGSVYVVCVCWCVSIAEYLLDCL